MIRMAWLAVTALLSSAPLLAQRPELRSPLTGAAFHALEDTAGSIAAADRAVAADPANVELLLAAGHARSALWRYHDAIDAYTRVIEVAPRDWRGYRFRGHRYISTRQLDLAVVDLERAAALDSLSFDVAYHLGLAHYLRGDFAAAADVYGRCMRLAESPAALALEASLPDGYRSCMRMASDPEDRVAIAEWRYRALRRAGRDAEAARLLATIGPDLPIQENASYYATLLLYKGLREADEVWDRTNVESNAFETIGYAIGNWRLLQGDTAGAHEIWRDVVERGISWNAFGAIAAEQELLRARDAARR